jgi:hypothetical protein
MRNQPVRSYLAEMLATEPPPGPYDPARYGKTWGGFWRYLREQALPVHLPHRPGMTPKRLATRRHHLRWLTAEFIALILAVVIAATGGPAVALFTALGCGVLCLAIAIYPEAIAANGRRLFRARRGPKVSVGNILADPGRRCPNCGHVSLPHGRR